MNKNKYLFIFFDFNINNIIINNSLKTLNSYILNIIFK